MTEFSTKSSMSFSEKPSFIIIIIIAILSLVVSPLYPKTNVDFQRRIDISFIPYNECILPPLPLFDLKPDLGGST